MKSFHKLFFLLLISCWTPSTVFSQSLILKNFSLAQVDDSVFLRWTILQGETCNGIKVHRSIDNLNFQQVGDIPGVCGSPDFAQPFEFIDDNPVKNTTNYYKLELGNTGFSEVLSIDVIALDDNGILVLPNPASESTTIHFKNEFNSPHIFSLYSTTGALLLETEVREKSFVLNTSFLEATVYIFTISEKGESSGVGGKITVMH